MKIFETIKKESVLIVVGSTGAVCTAAGVLLGLSLMSFGAPADQFLMLSVLAGVFLAVGIGCLAIMVRLFRKR